MPLPLDTATRNAIAAREVASSWLLELFCENPAGTPATLRGWDKFESLSYGGDTFEPLGNGWSIEGEIRGGVDLVSEPLVFSFDGGAQYDDASFVGRLLDRQWHLRPARLRQLLFTTSTNFTQPIGVVIDWLGFMNTIDAPEGGEGPSRVILTCESGSFRARARNLRTTTDADQRRRDANDASFRNVAVKPFQSIPFGSSWQNVPGYAAGSGGPGVSPGAIGGNDVTRAAD